MSDVAPQPAAPKPNPIFVATWGTFPLDQLVWAKPKKETPSVIVVCLCAYGGQPTIVEFSLPSLSDKERADVIYDIGKEWQEFKKN